MGTWNTMTTGGVVMAEHKLRTSRADRFAWMTDEAAGSRTRKSNTSSGRHLVVRFAGVVAALGAMLLAGLPR